MIVGCPFCDGATLHEQSCPRADDTLDHEREVVRAAIAWYHDGTAAPALVQSVIALLDAVKERAEHHAAVGRSPTR